MGHLDEIRMERYLDGNLSLPGMMMSRHHLSRCKECTAKLEALKKDRLELRSLAGIISELDEADARSASVTSASVSGLFSQETPREGKD